MLLQRDGRLLEAEAAYERLLARWPDLFTLAEVARRYRAGTLSPVDVIAAQPDIIVGSWCGKKFVPAKVAARPGFAGIPAVADRWLREIKSTLILQPGPAALTDGLDQLAGIISEWVEKRAA